MHEAIKQAAALATTRIQLREQQPQQEASSMDVLAQTRVESSYDDAGFERIIGSHAAKQTLKEAITLPTVLPELFQGGSVVLISVCSSGRRHPSTMAKDTTLRTSWNRQNNACQRYFRSDAE